ncbi:MAG: hypothetical protein D6706_19965, partial [Chloroflexi bacterium]
MTDQTNTQLLFRQARAAYKMGHLKRARQLLLEAARQNPQDHRVWLWLATVAPTPEKSLQMVQRAEMLQPDDPMVQKARAWAERRLRQQTAVSPPRSSNSHTHSWQTAVMYGTLSLLLII